METANIEPHLSTSTGEHSRLLNRSRLGLLAFTVVYVVLFSSAISTFIDEASSYLLATDSSLSHMFSALRDGADGSFPLYALLIYGWQKIFGASELSLRLNSGIFVLLFVWHSSKRLEQYFGMAAACLALLFVLSSKIFAYYALQARFYGLVLFMFSLVYWSTWELLQNKNISLQRRLWHALLCGLLCLSHPLGLLYAAILCGIYLTFSVPLRRFSFFNASAFLGGPGLFLLWLPSFLKQRLVSPTYAAGPPGWHKYWQFAFFDSTLLFLTVIVGLILLWARKSIAPKRLLHSKEKGVVSELPGNGLLVSYSLACLVCLNATFALLDAAHVMPVYWMQGIRYVLVGWVPYSVLLGWLIYGAADLLQQISEGGRIRVTRGAPFLFALLGLLLLMELHWSAWFRARASDTAFFSKIAAVAAEKHLDVVCESHWDAFYLATRTSSPRVFYLLDERFPFREYLLRAATYYPNPSPICPPGKMHFTNDYLFLTDSPREARIISPVRSEKPKDPK